MKIIQTIWYFIRDTYRDRHIILSLSLRDFKSKYEGSYLGFIWSLIQPFVMIGVLWFVFEKGLRAAPVSEDIPFIVWLAPGIVAWDYFANTLNGATHVFHDYSYLVKKINFRISLLPITKIISSIFSHVFLLIVTVSILFLNGFDVSFFIVQLLYYLFCMMCFTLGVAWIASSLQVFVKDIAQVIGMFLQFGFWLTPIIWNFDLVPEKFQFFFKLNPMFYIVEGYRRSMVYHAPFWEARDVGMYFWAVTLITLIVGLFLFKKLRPHFADVL